MCVNERQSVAKAARELKVGKMGGMGKVTWMR
jgi:hypothetical protein